MSSYLIEYLVGGYCSFGRVLMYSGYAENHEEFLSKFWLQYTGMVDCVKPKIFHLFLCENGIKKEIELTFAQKTGKI